MSDDGNGRKYREFQSIKEVTSISEKKTINETSKILEVNKTKEYNKNHSEENNYTSGENGKKQKTNLLTNLMKALALMAVTVVTIAVSAEASLKAEIEVVETGFQSVVYSLDITDEITDEELENLTVRVYNDFFEYVEIDISRGNNYYTVEELYPNMTYKIDLISSSGVGEKTIATTEFTSLNSSFDLFIYNLKYGILKVSEEEAAEEFYALQYDLYVHDPNEMIKEVLFFYSETYIYNGQEHVVKNEIGSIVDIESPDNIIYDFYTNRSSHIDYYIEVTYNEDNVEKKQIIAESSFEIMMEPYGYVSSYISDSIYHLDASVSYFGNDVTAIKLLLIQNNEIKLAYDILELGTIESYEDGDRYFYWSIELERGIIDETIEHEFKMIIDYQYLGQDYKTEKIFKVKANLEP